MSATSVLVERKSDRDIKFRDFYVTVDDLPERTLSYGDSTEFEISPGHHRISATNRLFTVHDEFDVKEGETARFEGINEQKSGPLSIFAIVISGTVMYRPVLERLS